MSDTWNPERYDRFAEERRRPFFDLLALVRLPAPPAPGPRVVDLGCGTGALTRHLHVALGARETLGIDSSAAMLAKSAAQSAPGLRFTRGDIADEVAREPRFAAALGGFTHATHVLAPEAYAVLLDRLGFAEQRVRLEVYAHRLTERRDVVAWVEGTLLTGYRARLDDAEYAAFVERYAERLLPRLGAYDPYLFTFKRILVWGRR